MQTIQLYVEGMRCPRCVREATARLRDLPGVATLTSPYRGLIWAHRQNLPAPGWP